MRELTGAEDFLRRYQDHCEAKCFWLKETNFDSVVCTDKNKHDELDREDRKDAVAFDKSMALETQMLRAA